MNQLHSIDPDDPRLTAYALGELEGEEAAQVAAAIAVDPALRAIVDDVRATAGRLTEALENEPMPAPSRPVHLQPYHTVRPARIFRFPYWAVAGMAAAACLVLVLTLNERFPTDTKPPRTANAKPAAAGEEQKSREAAPVSATEVQPSNHIEIQFSKDAGDADQQTRGVVVPNPVPGAEKSAPTTEPAASLPAPAGSAHVYAAKELKSAPQPQVAAAPPPGNDKLAESVRLPEATMSGSRYAEKRAKMETGTAHPVYFGESVAGLAPVPDRPAFNTETYDPIAESGFLAATQNPLSTFSLEVDTASYSNVRRFLLEDRRPPRDAVRIEEMVNYFNYGYAPPTTADRPFAASLEVASAPWSPTHRLVRVGLKGREVSTAARPAANLVFLVDVSGSMQEANKLPLVRESLRLLLGQLRADDRVAIVTYAGTTGLALPSTPVSHREEILQAIGALQAGGSTNGALGLQLAYDVAKANFIPGGVNRVLLATDGDFNVGTTDRGALVRLLEEKAKSGVYLTALGFGMGNLKDATLAQIAAHGHGTYAYIDSEPEARKVLVEQVSGTLAVIARSVKVQVEFNPALVQAYRLIGYDDRLLPKEAFNNDRVEAGDIGAGHTVTAFYEVIPAGVPWTPDSSVDPLKYQRSAQAGTAAPEADRAPGAAELLTVKVRYQPPEGGPSRRLEFPLQDRGASFADASSDFKFAAAVAGFGLVLRDSPHRGSATLETVRRWAAEGLGSDPGGHRGEFVALVERAEKILPSQG
jgi:Ca-activated chloride channel homolog